MIRSLVVWILVLQASFLFASVQRVAPDTVLPVSIARELPGIVIKRKPALGKSTGDTVHFHAGRFLTPGAFRLEDLVKNIPGFRVDDNGRIYFNGKEINRIMVDGDDIAGEQYQLLSRNLKALMVDSLQVIHRFEKNRLLRSIGNPDAIAVNLVIKKSFLGKLNGSLALAKDPGKHGEADGELVRLMQSSKHLLFANGNNVGGKGVADRGNERQSSSSRNSYRVWPFDKPDATNASGLPSAYVNLNKDQSLAFVSSFTVKKHSKLRVSSTAVHHENRSRLSKQSNYRLPGDQAISMLETSNELHALDGGSLRLDLEKDKGGNGVSSFHFSANPETLQVLHTGTRSGIGKASFRHNELRSNFNWHAVHQASWKTSASSLLQLENRMAVDRNNDKRSASFLNDNLMPLFIDQLLVQNGKMISTDIALISAAERYNRRVGFSASLQQISSSIGPKPLGLSLIKYYPNTDFVYRFSKKIDASFNAAAGAVVVKRNHIGKSSFVFQVDQQWVWQRKPIEKYNVGISVSRKNSAPKQWHAGPVVSGNTFWTGVQEIAFPLSMGAVAGMTKMDLYKGYTIAISATASIMRNDYGISTRLGSTFDSLQWFIVPVQENLVINGYAEQFIHLLKLKYSINANGMLLRMPQQLNGRIFNSVVRSRAIEQHFVSNWKGRFNAEVHVGLYSTAFLASANAVSLKRQQYGATTSLRFSPKLFGQLHCAVYKNGQRPSFVQFDGMFRAAISSHWKTSLMLSNLLNRQQYQENNIFAYGNGSSAQALNGRRILLGIHWGF